MAVLKCKICGGELELEQGSFLAECAHCGTKQTIPAMDDEKKINQFARANRLRLDNEFDKAAGIYESIVEDYPDEAEAYWGLVLCRYGIEYVEDPATGAMVPTCHRTSFNSVLDDLDLEMTLDKADPMARRLYREEAKSIEKLRKDIVDASSKNEPYDIFICYKETNDKTKQRTEDSVLAQEIYDRLVAKKYRVFFSRITLSNILGVDYESHIFAALHSAKVMLVVGTDYDNLNAVWVKNEWSRYLELMTKDRSKNLVLCFKDIDPEDIPKQLSRLQGVNMGHVGAMQDLLIGIDKLIPREVKQPAPTVVRNVAVDSLLERAYLLLQDGEFQKARIYFDTVLDRSPRESRAYWGKLLCQMNCVDNVALTGDNLCDQYFSQCVQNVAALSLSDGDITNRLGQLWGNAFKNACQFAADEEKRTYEACFAKTNGKLLERLHRKQYLEREQQRVEQERRAWEEEQRRLGLIAAQEAAKREKTKERIAAWVCIAILAVAAVVLFCLPEFKQLAVKAVKGSFLLTLLVQVVFLVLGTVIGAICRGRDMMIMPFLPAIMCAAYNLMGIIWAWEDGYAFGLLGSTIGVIIMGLASACGTFMIAFTLMSSE